MKFILATKQKMTQIFDESGKVYPATVVTAGPVTVTQVKSSDVDGYEAVQIGYGVQKDKNLKKAQRGHFADLGSFKTTREFRTPNGENQKGDVIDVKFRYWPELNESQTIRPDGRISLQVVDEVDASGITPKELDTRLTNLYEGRLRDPDISVIVRSQANQRVHVGGEVRSPGVIPLQGQLTVLEAITQTGGFINQSAQKSRVVVVRNVKNKRYAKVMDLKNFLRDTDSQPFYLEPNDIVLVTRTRIDKINQWVDQYISRMIPNISTPSVVGPSN